MKFYVKGAVAASLAMLTGCGVTTAPERAYVTAQPQTQAVRNVTSFTESLACMDDMFLAFGISNIVITSDGIPDATGRVGAGTKDMLISAISKMSVKSGAFTFVDFDQRQIDVSELHSLVGITEDFVVPRFYIRGAITGLDEGVIAESVGGGIALPAFDISVSRDQVVSIISVDMNMGALVTRQILPGVSANNTIAVARAGNAGDAGATIGKAGLFFNISLNKSEGLHQATRTLIDLSAIELAGKLAQVPYWRCLQIEHSNPEMVAQARSWFNRMEPTEKVAFTQRALASEGHYNGSVNGIKDAATTGAISRYQAENGLLADGRLDFALYQSLTARELALGERPTVDDSVPDDAAPVPLSVALQSAGAGFRVNDSLHLVVETTQDAYVYCYYQDNAGGVARIFPNRFTPDAYTIAGVPVNIPGEDSQFRIVFDQAGASEQVSCVASLKEIGLDLPNNFKIADLTPLPVNNVQDVVAQFRARDPQGLAVADLTINVTR